MKTPIDSRIDRLYDFGMVIDIDTESLRKEYRDLCLYCFTDLVGWTDHIFPMPDGSLLKGITENGRLASAAASHAYHAIIFGERTALSGISGVVTSPESRNRGYVREILVNLLQEEHARGTAASALYPFSFRFYEKFGYGLAGGYFRWKISPASLRKYDIHGEWRPFSGEREELERAMRLYNGWIGRYNFGILDLPDFIERYMKEPEWYHKKMYVYHEDGRMCAFLTFFINKQEPFTQILNIDRFAFADRNGFPAISEFMRSHRDQCREITFNSPCDIPFQFMAQEPRLPHDRVFTYMVRPVDLHRCLVLKAARRPPGGKTVFSVADEQIEANTGTYTIEGNEVTRTEYDPSVAIPLPLLSSLLFGGIRFHDAVRCGLIVDNPGFGEGTFFGEEPVVFFGKAF